MSRICKIILVCEDWRQSAFARGFLEAAGVDARSVEQQINPGGSGHDWVKSQFVEEVRELQRFSEGRGVLGLMDEDGQGVAARASEVDALLNRSNLPSISASAGRCLILPARNIETWLYWLTAQRLGKPVSVDEATDYKKTGPPTTLPRLRNEDCRPSGKHLHGFDHTSPPEGCPPLIGQAIGQLRAFLQAIRR